MQRRIFTVFFITALLFVSAIFSQVKVSANEWSNVNQSVEESEHTYTISGIAITPGSDETELYYAWYSTRNPKDTVVQIAKKSDMKEDVFPVEVAITFTGEATDAVEGFSSNKVVVTGIEPGETYVYRLGDGNNDHWSPVYDLNTQPSDDGYSFLMFGDPQIGAGNVPADTAGWINTVEKAVTEYPDTNFLVSVGDQVERATNEEHYDGYFAPEQLKNYAVATVQGNHDNSENYQYHFHTPNHNPDIISTISGGNYYYTYGNTLFMVLNTNAQNGAGHKAFMEEAIAAHPEAKWKIVINHQSIYSSANHSTSSSMANLRANLFPVFDELEIDVVLAGHDHSYTRSHQMLGDLPQLDQVVAPDGSVINPTGTLYITNNSASGSKYYNLRAPAPHEAVVSQPRVPTFSHVEVTDNSFTITAYVTETMEVVDKHTIVKDSSVQELELSEVTLSSNEDVLATTPSALLPNELSLSLRGKTEDGYSKNLSKADVEYKTSPEGILSIDSNGRATVANAAYEGSVEIWAIVEENGKRLESNKITVDVKHMRDTVLLPRESVWKYLDDGSDQYTGLGNVTDWRHPDFDDSTWASGPAILGYGGYVGEKTTVGFGPDSRNKYITTYFRTSFEVEGVDSFSNLKLSLLRDDGAVVYLNGQEIYRNNMPAGEINYLTFAASTIGKDYTYYEAEIDPSLLKEGENVLAVSIHQDRVTSSDIVFDMDLIATGTFTPSSAELAGLEVVGGELTEPFRSDEFEYHIRMTDAELKLKPFSYNEHAKVTINGQEVSNGVLSSGISLNKGQVEITVTAADGESNTYSLSVFKEENIVSKGSVWKYLDDGSDQYTGIENVTDWRHPNFDDSAWASGPAILGYGGYDGETTTVGYGPDSRNKYITTYFRKTFEVNDVDSYYDLKLSILRDDGAVVYLNGEEVYRNNMPSGEIGYLTLAASTIGKDYNYYEAEIAPSLLKEGENVLAVSIHQDRVTSSDIVFDLDLVGKYSPTSGGTPSEPETPGEPGETEEPETPGEPEVPGETEGPGTPGEPEVPGETEEPGTPGEPEVPGEIEEPETPSEPEVPGETEEPETPGEPEVPGEIEEPITPEIPESIMPLENDLSELMEDETVSVELDPLHEGVFITEDQMQKIVEQNAHLHFYNEDVQIEVPATIFNGQEHVIIKLEEVTDEMAEDALSKTYRFVIYEGDETITSFGEQLVTMRFKLHDPLEENKEAVIFYFNGEEWVSEWNGHQYGGALSEDRQFVEGTTTHFSVYAVYEVDNEETVPPGEPDEGTDHQPESPEPDEEDSGEPNPPIPGEGDKDDGEQVDPPAPGEPGTPDPSEPGESDPNEPGEPDPNEPGEPDPSEPGEPDLSEPGEPDPNEPGEPDPSEPGEPDPSEPGEPDPNEPGEPDPSEPGEPDPKEPGTPGPKEPGTPDPGEDKKDKQPKDDGLKKSKNEASDHDDRLPNTATNVWNILIYGFVLMLAGMVIFIVRKRVV